MILYSAISLSRNSVL